MIAVYSFFALSEYIVVITNILFHGMAVYDFGDGNLTFIKSVHSANKLFAADEKIS